MKCLYKPVQANKNNFTKVKIVISIYIDSPKNRPLFLYAIYSESICYHYAISFFGSLRMQVNFPWLFSLRCIPLFVAEFVSCGYNLEIG